MNTMVFEAAPGTVQTAYAVHETACTCGQSLDGCCAAHCPRCGVTLHHH